MAYTVRPDIWPLGANVKVNYVNGRTEVPACVGGFACRLVPRWEQEALAAGLADPGVAEAHVLAGHVSNRCGP